MPADERAGLLTRLAGLESELEHAHAADRAKSEFVAAVSHELRTPLSALLGFAELMRLDKKEPLSPRHLARIEEILKCAEHLESIIVDLAELSAIEQGAVPLRTEAVDVTSVLDDLHRMLVAPAIRGRISLRMHPGGQSLPVAVDRRRYLQILLNLGSNAVKYNTPGGTVSVEISSPAPEVTRVTVTDDGVGIPLERQPHLFHPFERAGQAAGAIPGTGLGLVVSRRLAEQMRVSIGFSSTPAKGSTFWVDAPVARDARRAQGPSLASSSGEGGAAMERRVV